MFKPQYFNVHWYGPHSVEDAEKLDAPNLVLYMICGTHGIYGKSVPLYIGKTFRTVSKRLGEHKWIEREPDPVQVYVAAISKPFQVWNDIENDKEYSAPDNRIIEEVESLIIYAHQPAYNARSKGGTQHVDDHLVIFNTGRRSTLHPEISSMYWYA